MLATNPIAISRCRRRRAVRPIVLLSVSREERAKDHPNRPRRWRTAALDVLAERSRRSRPSVQRRVLRRLLRRRSCFAQARAATTLSAACWAVAAQDHFILPENPRAARALKQQTSRCRVVDDVLARRFRWLRMHVRHARTRRVVCTRACV